MLRTTLSALAIVLATSFAAQAKMNCDAKYADFWSKVTDAAVSLDASRLATINRMASRAYDACQAGDEQSAQAFFDKLSQEGSNSTEFFQKLAEEGSAK